MTLSDETNGSDGGTARGRWTVGDVLHELILGDAAGSGFGSRLSAMILGWIVLHAGLMAIAMSLLTVEQLAELDLVLYLLLTLFVIFVALFVLICRVDPPRGHLTRYFSLGVLLPGAPYFLSASIARVFL